MYSWNKSLAYDQAYAMAGEFKRAGATVSLGPAVLGPFSRIARGGRNWEGFAADPYLSGILGANSVEGAQDGGVVSCTKVRKDILRLSVWCMSLPLSALHWKRARRTSI